MTADRSDAIVITQRPQETREHRSVFEPIDATECDWLRQDFHKVNGEWVPLGQELVESVSVETPE